MVILTNQRIDVAALRDAIGSPRCGAVVTFEGVVRDHNEQVAVSAITYEAYESMAKKEIEKIVRRAEERWPDVRAAVAHRTGHLVVGEVSVVVIAAAPHRPAAFEAARFLIDEVKKSVPIWKHETASTRIR